MRSMMQRGLLGRRGALAGAGAVLAAPAIARADGTNGVALVIGNSKYQWEAQLPNVRRDAPDIAKHFQALGLTTDLVLEVNLDAMKQALDKFNAAASNARFATFYFAGHGATWGDGTGRTITYLVPVDCDLSKPESVRNLIGVPAIRPGNQETRRLLVFDNCRNNPADGWRQVEASRSAAQVPEKERALALAAGLTNTLTLFSTSPGRVALDGPAGENSPFAAALMRQLNSTSVDLQSLPSRLRRDLLIATEGRQVLWERNTYEQPFSLNGNPKSGTAMAAKHDPSRVVELTKAYAYARENGLPLPSGLIAYRPAANSPESIKIGSYKYIADSPIGHGPQLLIVLSVESQKTVDVIVAGRGIWNATLRKGEEGVYWRVSTVDAVGSKLEFTPRDGAARFAWSWSDANSGDFTMTKQAASAPIFGSRFTRLDG